MLRQEFEKIHETINLHANHFGEKLFASMNELILKRSTRECQMATTLKMRFGYDEDIGNDLVLTFRDSELYSSVMQVDGDKDM